MTTLQIETLADPGQLASADLDLKMVLRRKVIYELLYDLGYPSWSRTHDTKALAAGARYVDVTTNTFRQMRSVFIAPYYEEQYGLTYIGDDDSKVLAAMATTATEKPTQYYLGFTGSRFERIYFNTIADAAYTVAFVYYKRIPFVDDSSSLDLDPYIPADAQWPLVEGLRRYLYRERVGLEDRRYIEADQEYGRWIARLSENPEKSAGAKGKYVR